MMAHKHLHELLREDQEPFLLKNYISDRRSQLKKSIQPRKRKPIIDSSISKPSLYKQACFFSFQNSPDLRKSPCKSPNAVRLHIPARTAALLLESAMRIQKQSSAKKPRTQIKNVGFGLFGSIFKILSSKNRTRNCEIGGGDKCRVMAMKSGVKGEKSREIVHGVEDESAVEMAFPCAHDNSRRNSPAWSTRKSGGKGEKSRENVVGVEDENSAVEMGFSFSCNYSRRNSTIWSESNEEKSIDLETCCSSRSDEWEEIEERENGDFAFCEKSFCSSPLSPFRFALQTSPSPGRRTPVFLSPATSPSRLNKQEEDNCEVVESIENIQLVQEEEEKEQFSPVSVLDPPFEDDDDGDGNEEVEEEGSYDLECSYAIVQRAKLLLLHKLRRFEKLAGLDPIELEKRMLEEQDDESENEDLDEEEEEEELEEAETLSSDKEDTIGGYLREVLTKSGIHLSKVPGHTKRLVLDLVAEEERRDEGTNDCESVVKRISKRLDCWKEEQSQTIDMMVEFEFNRGSDGWKRTDQEQVREAAMEIEVSIFGSLVEELSEELVDFFGDYVDLNKILFC